MTQIALLTILSATLLAGLPLSSGDSLREQAARQTRQLISRPDQFLEVTEPTILYVLATRQPGNPRQNTRVATITAQGRQISDITIKADLSRADLSPVQQLVCSDGIVPSYRRVMEQVKGPPLLELTEPVKVAEPSMIAVERKSEREQFILAQQRTEVPQLSQLLGLENPYIRNGTLFVATTARLSDQSLAQLQGEAQQKFDRLGPGHPVRWLAHRVEVIRVKYSYDTLVEKAAELYQALITDNVDSTIYIAYDHQTIVVSGDIEKIGPYIDRIGKEYFTLTRSSGLQWRM